MLKLQERYSLRETFVELRNVITVDLISIGLVIAAHGKEAHARIDEWVGCYPLGLKKLMMVF